MTWWEILIIAAAALFVLSVIAVSIWRRKQGKSSCGCDCGSCPNCSGCKTAAQKKEK